MKEQLKKAVIGSNFRKMKMLSMILAVSLLTIFSCQEEEGVVVDKNEVTVTESEITPEIQQMLDKEKENITLDDVVIGGGDVQQFGCRAGVRQRDYAGTAAVVANAPFYNNTVINEFTRANGSCNFPTSLNQPCIFIGSLTIVNKPGMTGNYRIITPFGTVFDVDNVTNSYTFFYGRPQLPLAVFCGFINRYIIEAENPNAPGTYTRVYEVAFICTNCNFGPVDPSPVGQ